jgi:hypothetical protein
VLVGSVVCLQVASIAPAAAMALGEDRDVPHQGFTALLIGSLTCVAET